MFKKFVEKENEENINNKNILITALLIHAAKIDDNYTDVEKEIIKNLKKDLQKLRYLHKAEMIDIQFELEEVLAAKQFDQNKFLDLSSIKLDLEREKHEQLANALIKLSPKARIIVMKMITKKQRNRKNKH